MPTGVLASVHVAVNYATMFPVTDMFERGLPTPYDEAVLDLVAMIPAGTVLAYGDVARLLGRGGPRQVGAVMSKFGAGVPWHRVIRADGCAPLGHESEARRRWAQEGTPMTGDGLRVRMNAARWPGPGESATEATRA